MTIEGLERRVQLGPDEWTIQCGQPDCGTTLADVAWIDINFNMAVNGAEAEGGSAATFANLPAPHLRRYRLAVMFPLDWVWSKTPNIWQVDLARTNWRYSPAGGSNRTVRGGWSVAELGRMGSPPLAIVCFACGTLQTVPAERRKGTPPIPKAPAPGQHGPPSVKDEAAVLSVEDHTAGRRSLPSANPEIPVPASIASQGAPLVGQGHPPPYVASAWAGY